MLMMPMPTTIEFVPRWMLFAMRFVLTKNSIRHCILRWNQAPMALSIISVNMVGGKEKTHLPNSTLTFI